MKQFWIFGYGSLMWRPGFAFRRSGPALIHGYHRRLCVYSHVHRGTPDRPGLVLGLDRGGSCHGVAFEIEASAWDETISYLREREQVTNDYVEKHAAIQLLPLRETVGAVTYIVDRHHPQYAGTLTPQQLRHHVRQGQGISGDCTDYVLNTRDHLRSMNIHDAALEALGLELEAQAATMTEQPSLATSDASPATSTRPRNA